MINSRVKKQSSMGLEAVSDTQNPIKYNRQWNKLNVTYTFDATFLDDNDNNPPQQFLMLFKGFNAINFVFDW